MFDILFRSYDLDWTIKKIFRRVRLVYLYDMIKLIYTGELYIVDTIHILGYFPD